MQKVVIEEPYRFVPPYRGTVWSSVFRKLLPAYLRAFNGITEVECRGLDRLRESVAAGRGVLLAPNHCRLSDPMTVGWLVRETGIHTYTMASWHLFRQDGSFQKASAWMMRRLGAFSLFREGTDRTALTTSIDILATAERPLIIFPEGVVSGSNDRLGPLMDGVPFIARAAAKKAQKAGRPGVVVHPVALRYVFLDDVERAVDPVLAELEARLTWRPRRSRPGLERVKDIAHALLLSKEVEYLGRPLTGDWHERRRSLIGHLLRPIEEEHALAGTDESVVTRVKDIRTVILAKLLDATTPEREKVRLRDQLADAYLAQQLSFHPESYLAPGCPPEHLLEMVERLEEDVTDRNRIYGRMKVLIDVGEAIPVEAERDRRAARGGPDPMLETLAARLRAMLDASGREVAAARRTPYRETTSAPPEKVAAAT